MDATTELDDESGCLVKTLEKLEGQSSLVPTIEKSTAILMFAAFAIFSMLIGVGYNALRKYVFKDYQSLDVVFDAGGKVSFSLTAVTVTSQLLWPADFLQSPTLASKVGIGGSLWYTMAVVLSTLVFPMLCIHLKIRAPGAKTFPQIAYARFGPPAHILFCIVALLTNLVIISNLILAGKSAIEVLVKDANDEFVVLVLTVLFGSYCLIGGLGTTFYMSYFNAAVIFITTSIFVLKLTYLAEPAVVNSSSTEALYKAMSCLEGPAGNYNNSYLTFRTQSGIIYGVVMLFMTIAIVFCDQANWQSRIAAKPKDGIIGFFIAAFLWFAIPTSLSFVTSMTYKSLSYRNGTNLLTDDDIDKGYIGPYVMNSLLGIEGAYLLLTMLTMALMSTGSGEVMSISSILIYDIYKIYINPYRKNLEATACILCGQDKLLHPGTELVEELHCTCRPASECGQCQEDTIRRAGTEKLHQGDFYTCSLHGEYRRYEDLLIRRKTWCMVVVVVGIIPFGLLVISSGMNLNWTYMAAQVFIAPFILPLFLTIAWSKATSQSLIIGGVSGLCAAITAMFATASTYDGGLGNFFVNTTQDISLLAGLGAGVLVSTVIAIGMSLYYNKISSPEDVEREWQKTMSIDNPLSPYRELYAEELKEIDHRGVLTSKTMERIFRRAKYSTYIGAGVSFALFFVAVPAASLGQPELSLGQLSMWISVCQHWCLIATVLVVFVPPIQEGVQIWRQYRDNAASRKPANLELAQINRQDC